MELGAVLAVLRAHRVELDALGVGSISVFGSVARGEAGPDSDVDLLVEFSKPMDLFLFADIQEALTTWLGRRVDLVPKSGVMARIRDHVLREAVHAT